MNMNHKISFLPIIIFLLLTSCGAKDPSEAIFTFIDITEPISVHTDSQKAYLSDEYKNILKYANNDGEKSYPEAVHLSWNVNSNTKAVPKSYSINVWEKDDSEHKWEFTSQSNNFDLFNVKLNQCYEYKVTAHYKNIEFNSDVHSFTTDDCAPRNLRISGATNVRDLYGIGDIKQNRIFRSGEFNDGDSESFKLNLDDEGLYSLNTQLGIKTEIDVRKDSETGGQSLCAFNESANYYHIPMAYQGPSQVMNYKQDGLDNASAIKDFFEVLSDSENYPIVYHCTFGRDRTGFLSYLIEALCGGSEDELMRDYLFTDFADVTPVMVSTISGTAAYPSVINKYEGETLKDRVISYLISSESKCPNISIDTLNSVIANLCN